MGKVLIAVGIVLIVIGILVQYVKIPFGSLPGDIHIKRENINFFFPITSSILISLLISLAVYLFQKLR